MLDIIFMFLFAVMACISALGFILFLITGIIELIKDSSLVITVCLVVAILAGSVVGYTHLFNSAWHQNINNIKSSAAK